MATVPSWTVALDGLTPRCFGTLATALRREGVHMPRPTLKAGRSCVIAPERRGVHHATLDTPGCTTSPLPADGATRQRATLPRAR